MNERIEHKDSVEYIINEPTEKAAFVAACIAEGFKAAHVEPEETMPVLGEAIIQLLTHIADLCGYEPLSMIKSFGQGIVTAEIEFREYEKQGEQNLANSAKTCKDEQKPAWSEDDETTKNNISHIIRQYDKISKRENQPCWYIGDCLLWMQNIKDRVLPQPKQEWSDYDISMIDNIIYDEYCSLGIETIEWLKSIKNKIQLQPAEWSEEDEKILSDIIKDLVHPWNEYIPDRIEEEIKWLKNRLKSLRPQNR